MNRPEPDGLVSPHGGAGDHNTVRIRRVMDSIDVFECLHLGVNSGGGGGPGCAQTGILAVPDQ